MLKWQVNRATINQMVCFAFAYLFFRAGVALVYKEGVYYGGLRSIDEDPDVV